MLTRSSQRIINPMRYTGIYMYIHTFFFSKLFIYENPVQTPLTGRTNQQSVFICTTDTLVCMPSKKHTEKQNTQRKKNRQRVEVLLVQQLLSCICHSKNTHRELKFLQYNSDSHMYAIQKKNTRRAEVLLVQQLLSFMCHQKTHGEPKFY